MGKRIFAIPDLTKKQIDNEGKVRLELKRGKNGGKTNIGFDSKLFIMVSTNTDNFMPSNSQTTNVHTVVVLAHNLAVHSTANPCRLFFAI